MNVNSNVFDQIEYNFIVKKPSKINLIFLSHNGISKFDTNLLIICYGGPELLWTYVQFYMIEIYSKIMANVKKSSSANERGWHSY